MAAALFAPVAEFAASRVGTALLYSAGVGLDLVDAYERHGKDKEAFKKDLVKEVGLSIAAAAAGGAAAKYGAKGLGWAIKSAGLEHAVTDLVARSPKLAAAGKFIGESAAAMTGWQYARDVLGKRLKLQGLQGEEEETPGQEEVTEPESPTQKTMKGLQSIMDSVDDTKNYLAYRRQERTQKRADMADRLKQSISMMNYDRTLV